MQPWLEDADVRLYHGDVLNVLRELPAESVDCCVTSPPYWGLRDYGTGAWDGGDAECDHKTPPSFSKTTLGTASGGNAMSPEARARFAEGQRTPYRDVCAQCGAVRTDQQLGLEPTPEQYVTRMVEVFREVRRVLAAHGTVWLNLGDSYAGTGAVPGQGWDGHGGDVGSRASWAKGEGKGIGDKRHHPPSGLKQKDLCGIPWRVAFALQADGWYLRSDIIWAKPNPMPESVTDRPTKAHEYVFLLSKQPRYFFDQEAVREPWVGEAQNGKVVRKRNSGGRNDGYTVASGTVGNIEQGRNIRSVWEIATQPYPEAHFATFPEELARRCIAAGCPERVCSKCGAPWLRITERIPEKPDAKRQRNVGGRTDGFTYPAEPGGLGTIQVTTLGWKPSCGHTDRYRVPLPAVVLDPFMGSGTVAHVARKLGRHAVGIDLNESYLELAARRLQQQSLFAEAASGL